MPGEALLTYCDSVPGGGPFAAAQRTRSPEEPDVGILHVRRIEHRRDGRVPGQRADIRARLDSTPSARCGSGHSQCATHAIGTGLSSLVFDATGESLYIADAGTDQVLVVNVADLSAVTSIAVGDTPMGIDLAPGGSLLFVANLYNRGVWVIATLTNSETTTIDFGTACFPRDLDISADGSTVYVATGIISGDDGLWVIG